MHNEAREVIKDTIKKLKVITKKLEAAKFPNHQDIKDNKAVVISLNVAMIADDERKK